MFGIRLRIPGALRMMSLYPSWQVQIAENNGSL